LLRSIAIGCLPWTYSVARKWALRLQRQRVERELARLPADPARRERQLVDRVGQLLGHFALVLGFARDRREQFDVRERLVDAFQQPRFALGAAVRLHQHFDQLAQRRVGHLPDRVERVAVSLHVVIRDLLRALVASALGPSPAANHADCRQRQRAIGQTQHFELLRVGQARRSERLRARRRDRVHGLGRAGHRDLSTEVCTERLTAGAGAEQFSPLRSTKGARAECLTPSKFRPSAPFSGSLSNFSRPWTQRASRTPDPVLRG
jgi:hypothetical protein